MHRAPTPLLSLLLPLCTASQACALGSELETTSPADPVATAPAVTGGAGGQRQTPAPSAGGSPADGGGGGGGGGGGYAVAGGAGGMAVGGNAGTGGSAPCDNMSNCSACSQCAKETECNAAQAACTAEWQCGFYVGCVAGCANELCIESCQAVYPNGASSYQTLAACVCSACPSDCTAQGCP
jgi:hypothetical protein